LNIQDIISQLTSEVINGDTTSASAKFACEINSYIINYKLLNINLSNTQLKNTKILYRKGLISKLDFEKYNRYCVICRLQNN
ncbi:hypothetical protein NAI59_11085, partial [Francisella tularensis subsp. holarctica]|uniref:hypothetical protein n=1 Tax=Francisella tularensis TaxID=263 RepID=UPI002381BC81